MPEDIEYYKSLLENEEFETRIPTIFFKCESAVFVKDDTNSLCYTTSEERAEVLTSILNEWAEFRQHLTIDGVQERKNLHERDEFREELRREQEKVAEFIAGECKGEGPIPEADCR